MKFMIIRKADAETEAENDAASPELLAAMMAYNDEMLKAGVMLQGNGLRSSAAGARVKFHGGKPTVVDGPFTEAKELIAGFSIIEVASKTEAIEWVKRWPQIDGHGEVELEIRQVFELEDFGGDRVQELREHEARMRANQRARPKNG
jgi:hypothetical protein